MNMTFLLHLLVCLSFGWVTWAQSLPPWEQEAFYFGWEPYNGTLTRCGTINLSVIERPGFSSISPYTVLLYRGGQAPYRFSTGPGLFYLWTVNLNPGGPYLLAMEDARGSTGGTSRTFNVEATTLSCPSSGETPQTLALRLLTTSTPSCGTVSFEVSDGTPPYTLTVSPGVMQPKTVIYAIGRFDYTLDLPAGTDVAFSVQDASGRGAVTQVYKVSQGTNAACLTAAPTALQASPLTTYPGVTPTAVEAPGSTQGGPSSSSTGAQSDVSGSPNPEAATKKSNGPPIPAVVGGAIGGFAVLLLLLLLAIFIRSRKRKRSEQYTYNKNKKDPVTGFPPNTSSHPSMSNAGTSMMSPSFRSEQQNRFSPPPPEVMEPTRDVIYYPIPNSLVHPYQQYRFSSEQPRALYQNQFPTSAEPTLGLHYSTPPHMAVAPLSQPNSPPLAPSNEEKHISWLSGVSGSSSATAANAIRTDPQGQWGPPSTGHTDSPAGRFSSLSNTSATSQSGSPGASPRLSAYQPPPKSSSPPPPPGAKLPFQSMNFGGQPHYNPHTVITQPLGPPPTANSRSPPPQYWKN